MLKINNKLKLPLIFSILGISGLFLYQYLTFIPEYSNATTIETPVLDPNSPKIKTLEDISSMSELTSQICANTRTPSASETITVPSKVLNDTSGGGEGRSYQTSKLKDGNCWMVQNINNSIGRLSQSSYGGYYTYTDAVQLCPRLGQAWSLPAQTTYQNLVNQTSATTLLNIPYNFQLSGYYNTSGKLVGTAEFGWYWSSTESVNGYNAYSLFLSSSSVNPSSNDTQRGGLAVRCFINTDGITPNTPDILIPSSNINITVPNIITLDVSDSVDIATESGRVNTGEFTTIVSSNKDYTISLNAAAGGADATSLVNYKDGNKVGEIPTITGANQPAAGISGWGIMLCNGTTTNTCTNNYLPLPTKNTTNTFTTGTKGIHQHLFQIGIGIGPELPSGTYTTSIQVTASQK